MSLDSDDALSVYIYFSDSKIIQVGALLSEEQERQILVREWPKRVKTIRLDCPEATDQEPVTRKELRKALEDLERRQNEKATDARIDAAR